ncbi:FN3 associated domain-containing protein [Pedobacter frigoris]|uniref:Cytochrome C n=1 Tax=Pedobacter frigoris TaxID=2571272 RepID=A0A4U1CMH3_9SPHI|nr:FN3 associated domain-containing protein [Pedobacter frigoris]TKC08593.1 cytochrome C [Pedobacter frigoris]
MKFTLKGFAGNLLFAANVFILFLLLFGGEIIIPYWLQPIGRLHPMILHFPIVILMLAMILDFFRFKESYAKEPFYQSFVSWLLLTGALFSAITVIMGLFLSKEEGYTGSVLQWHKWTGVSIVFIASLIYWCRDFSWYKLGVSRVGAVVIVSCLLATGHFGATLTHGENFVLGPVTSAAEPVKVPIEKAMVFKDVVMPIFTQKCLNCHNLEKAKGSLIMTDSAGLFKGGKSGKLFVPGKPEISLLLERIHLPEDEKKHMPPKGKPQLTADEVAILKLWVKANAQLKGKVTELAPGDSLRMLATAFLAPEQSVEEKFDFAMADEETVTKLNNNYRAVYPIAKESPALAVNIYNKDLYKPEVLKELTSVKQQIISLNLNGLPVKDADLKIISQFVNLRKLNLNFTALNGEGLKELKSLKHLNGLSLSGTGVSYAAIKQIVNMPELKQLALWNTQITPAEIAQLQKLNGNLEVIKGFKDDGKSPAKLNLPRIGNEKSVFSKSINLDIKHAINGVQIRYTTDGSEPDSIKSLLYKKGIVIAQNTSIKAKAYKKGWFGSDAVSFTFYKSTFKPDSVVFLTAANEKYRASGPEALTDSQMGTYDINAGSWIGFREHHMEALMFFKTPVNISAVSLNVMRQLPVYVLPPEEVEIWGGPDKNKLVLLGKTSSRAPLPADEKTLMNVETKFNTQKISCLKIVAKNLKKLPKWHPGKGEPAWIFIDEVFLN